MSAQSRRRRPQAFAGAPGSVRIISGTWRRQRVRVPGIAGLRPTGDRVRETLFNWLGPRIEGAICADLFAGSGVLGFEAVSRGAAAVTLIEKDPQCARALTEEHERLRALAAVQTDVQIRCADALSWLSGPGASRQPPLDVVFVDPPFGSPLAGLTLEHLVACGGLNADARIYVETGVDEDLDLPAGLEYLRSERAGRVRYHLARPVIPEPEPPTKPPSRP